MYKSVIIISLAILALPIIFGCSDKSTDPGNSDPEPEKWKHFTVYAGVKDSTGAPVRMAWIFMTLYTFNDSIPGISGAPTDDFGMVRIMDAVLINKDSVSAYAFKDSLVSDTIRFRVYYDGQEFYLNFQLTGDSTI